MPVISAISDAGERNDTPAQTPSAPIASSEHVGEPLAQPALHAPCGDQHQFLGERVGQGIGQQRTEPVGEEVGAISTMEVERHWGPR